MHTIFNCWPLRCLHIASAVDAKFVTYRHWHRATETATGIFMCYYCEWSTFTYARDTNGNWVYLSKESGDFDSFDVYWGIWHEVKYMRTKWTPNHIVPWLWLITIFNFVSRSLSPLAVFTLLYMSLAYALIDICRSRGDGATLFVWCLYACAAGAIFLWQCVVQSEWMFAVLIGAIIGALLILLRWIWSHLV